MITIISATNRPDSRTEYVSSQIFKMLGKFTDEEVNLIKLSEVDHGFVHPKMYDEKFQHPDLTKIQDEQIIPADKWILISPEYNGSYSGIGKVFIDALSIRKYADTFKGKKLALVGVATGRAGNLRGLDHLTTSFNYLGMNVFPNRLPLAKIADHITDHGFDEEITKTLDGFLESFVSY